MNEQILVELSNTAPILLKASNDLNPCLATLTPFPPILQSLAVLLAAIIAYTAAMRNIRTATETTQRNIDAADKRMREEFEHDRRQKEISKLKEKAEELYEAFDEWAYVTFQDWRYLLQVAEGYVTYDEYEAARKQLPDSLYRPTKVRMLIEMYFYGLFPLWIKHHLVDDEMNKVRLQCKIKTQRGKSMPDDILQTISTSMNKQGMFWKEFHAKLLEETAKKVRQLEKKADGSERIEVSR